MSSVEPEHHTATIAGARLHYVVAGAGPTWLLVHGMMGSWRNFAAWWSLLTAHFRVVAPDLPGCGRSSELTGPHTVAANADVLCALARQLAVEPVGVAALGLGAAPAIAALGAGLPAQRLVVYAPVYGPTTVRARFRLLAYLAQQRPVTAGLAWLSRQERVLTLLRRWLGQEKSDPDQGDFCITPKTAGGGVVTPPRPTWEGRFLDSRFRGNDDLCQGLDQAGGVAADVRRASVRAAVELVYDAVTCDQRSQVARLNIPTLALAAPDDPLLPAAASFALPQLMPRAEAVLLPPARHGWPPHVVAAQLTAIARFLGLPAPSADGMVSGELPHSRARGSPGSGAND